MRSVNRDDLVDVTLSKVEIAKETRLKNESTSDVTAHAVSHDVRLYRRHRYIGGILPALKVLYPLVDLGQNNPSIVREAQGAASCFRVARVRWSRRIN